MTGDRRISTREWHKEAERLREENEKLSAELTKCKDDLEKAASLSVIIERLERITGTAAGEAAGSRSLAAKAADGQAQGMVSDPQAAVQASDRAAAGPDGMQAASAAVRGFRYTRRDPQADAAEDEKDSYPPLGTVMEIRPVGFRLAGMRK